MSDSKPQQQPIEQLIANRLAKLDELRQLGVEPYPTRYRVDESVSAAKRRFADSTAEELADTKPEVRLAGRLRAVRGHGKVSFADLSDGADQLQIYLRKNDLDETCRRIHRSESSAHHFVMVDLRNSPA